MLKLKLRHKLQLNNKSDPERVKVKWRGSFWGPVFFVAAAVGVAPRPPEYFWPKEYGAALEVCPPFVICLVLIRLQVEGMP